jgi:membrane associated rhomboid family serine protease
MFPLRDNAPKGAFPIVTVLLILVNVWVFYLQLTFPGGFEASLFTWGMRPKLILAGGNIPGTDISAWWTILTSMFMHGGLMHIIGNMMGLWLFGDNVEWLLGRVRFILFYLASGLIAGTVTMYLGSSSDLPGIGASGALAGVMAAYLIFYPTAKVTTLLFFGIITIIDISALWYIGGWIAMQLFQAGALLANGVNINAGIYAHAAGAIAGAILVWPLLLRSRRPGAWDNRTHQYRRRALWD